MCNFPERLVKPAFAHPAERAQLDSLALLPPTRSAADAGANPLYGAGDAGRALNGGDSVAVLKIWPG